MNRNRPAQLLGVCPGSAEGGTMTFIISRTSQPLYEKTVPCKGAFYLGTDPDGDRIWAIELGDSIQDLLDFMGSPFLPPRSALILDFKYFADKRYPSIEIYDDYRE